MDYMLKRWPAFTRFLDDVHICLSNNIRMLTYVYSNQKRRCGMIR